MEKKTEKNIGNFGRFYAALKKMPILIDADEVKRQLVMEYTHGRTESLREMAPAEYDACCRRMEEMGQDKAEQRRWRSVCLRLMQGLGIDTTDWARVNDFCQHPRICGKPFAWLSISELEDLSRKLRAIEKHGGLSRRKDQGRKTNIYLMNIQSTIEA